MSGFQHDGFGENFAVVVQGAFLVGDSISMDAVYQFNVLRESFGDSRVKLFAETHSANVYPGVPFTAYSQFDDWTRANPDGTVIYHYCDGWRAFETALRAYRGRKIVRWHNNTPPWFYAEQPSAMRSTIRGLKSILALIEEQDLEIWANSEFSRRQLEILAGARQQSACVFPASAYLDASSDQPVQRRDLRPATAKEPLEILFVSRVVAHKGHKHVIAVADLITRTTGRPTRVHFVGRRDDNGLIYNALLADLCERAACEVIFHGGLPKEELDLRFARANAFLCLSEHEGFGLPAFEAMRRDVPVVAWANTAYEDLLDGTPLAFREFDLANFAAAVHVAADPIYRQLIAEVQDVVVSQYSRAVVRQQILGALGEPQLPASDRAERAASVVPAAAALASAVASLSDMYRLHIDEAVGGEQRRDFVGNYISAYDVEAFDVLLNAATDSDRLFEILKPETDASERKARISAAAFLSKVAEFRDKAWRFDGDLIEGDHLFYGPYFQLPRGKFGFHVLFEISKFESKGHLHLEVVSGQTVLGARDGRVVNGFLEAHLEVETLTPQSDVEIRIAVSSPIRLVGAFKGVIVERLPAISALVPQGSDRLSDDGATLTIPPSNFFTHHGALCGDKIDIRVENPREAHIIYGPYTEMPKGRYRLGVLLEAQETPKALWLEIVEGGEIADRVSLKPDADGRFVVEVEVGRRLQRGEFRLTVDDDQPFRGAFRGVAVTRLPTLENLLTENKVLTAQGVKTQAGKATSVFFEADLFKSPLAVVSQHRLTFAGQTAPKGEPFLQGPYTSAPAGRFRFRMHFDFKRFATSNAVSVDVMDGQKLLAHRDVSTLNDNTTINCEFLSHVEALEVRVTPAADVNLLGHFRGMTVERLPGMAELATLEPPPSRTEGRQNGRFNRLRKWFSALPRQP